MSSSTVALAWHGEFPSGSGGVAIFTFKPDEPFLIRIHAPLSADPGKFTAESSTSCEFNGKAWPCVGAWVGVYITESYASFMEGNDSFATVNQQFESKRDMLGVCRSFWLSFDRCNRNIKFGMGHYREETVLLNVDLPSKDGAATFCGVEPVKLSVLGPKFTFKAGNGMDHLLSSKSSSGQQPEARVGVVEMDPRPLSRNLGPLVVEPASLSLADWDPPTYVPAVDLPPACQWLYAVMSGPNVSVTWDLVGGISLVDAIRDSLRPGGLLHSRLEEKRARWLFGVPPCGASATCAFSVALPDVKPHRGSPLVMGDLGPLGHLQPHPQPWRILWGCCEFFYGEVRTLIFNQELDAFGANTSAGHGAAQ
eukprot:jgi/Botrbrau1/9234/Bobra.0028s0029.1